jgi:carboxyl-terminal processing protease
LCNQNGIQGLVVDLRDNGGGSVDEAVRMTGLFINQGPVVQLKDPNREIHLVTEQPGKALYEGPMVVLENKLTASASEIFSAAMQDYRRAAIVGDSSTYGKGSVQAVIELNRFIDKIGDTSDLAGALKIRIRVRGARRKRFRRADGKRSNHQRDTEHSFGSCRSDKSTANG